MEKAILKTLVYSDIFDYPLKSWEIHKWLISKSCSLKDLEKPLVSLKKKKQIEEKKGYYFLTSKKALVKKREERNKHSDYLYKKAKAVSQLFRLIPWVLLVGISGSLSMKNASKADDIDLFIITQHRRLWLSRLIILLILSVVGLRRKKRENTLDSRGKICINILLDNNSLAQYKRNIYIAHELLQMQVLWQRQGIYGKYLEDNNWAFKLLPNWIGDNRVKSQKSRVKEKNKYIPSLRQQELRSLLSKRPKGSLRARRGNLDLLEMFAGFIQKKYMGKPQGVERISDSALYFHPNDYSESILDKYKKGLKKIKV